MRMKRALIGCDFHFQLAYKLACDEFADKAKHDGPWDALVLAGDFWDIHCLSNFEKNPFKTARFLEDELGEGREYLSRLDMASKAKNKVFLCGNHEARITKYVYRQAPYMAKNLNEREILGIPDDWTFKAYNRSGCAQLGPLIVTHGVKCGVMAAKNNLVKYMCDVLTGHVHRNASYSATGYNGKPIHSHTIGGMWDVKAVEEYQLDVIDGTRAYAEVLYNDTRYEVITHTVK